MKKGFVMIVFEVPDLQPTFFGKKKAKNAEVELAIPNEPGVFGSVKFPTVEYLLEATSDRFGSVRAKWVTEDSYYEVMKGEIHVYLKDV